MLPNVKKKIYNLYDSKNRYTLNLFDNNTKTKPRKTIQSSNAMHLCLMEHNGLV